MKRLSGYRIAAREAGLNIPDGYIRYGNWEYESGIEKAKELLALPVRPIAIFAMNDLMAAGCIHALTDAGLGVPKEMAVVGFDNREIASYLQPPLTTVALPSERIGVRAATQILARIRNAALPPEREIIHCSIIERQSV
jgi:DNA-binding LacI/PurR family transcriptional regulator